MLAMNDVNRYSDGARVIFSHLPWCCRWSDQVGHHGSLPLSWYVRPLVLCPAFPACLLYFLPYVYVLAGTYSNT
jgi:hypothetical protein